MNICSQDDKNKATGGRLEFSLNRLYFYLTEGCNLACRHCWLSPPVESETTRALPVETFERIINEALPLGLSGVKLTGGEPLLHPEFPALLEIVRENELHLSVETNGVLCSKRIAAEIARSPDCAVAVSIDGANAETHDHIRGVPGAFKQVCRAAENLANAGVAPQIIMTVMRHNAGQVGNLVEMAENLGASSVKFNIVQPISKGERLRVSKETLSAREIIELGRHVEMKVAPDANIGIIFDLPMAFRPLSRIATGIGNDICGILGILGVLADGSYALCGIGNHIPELVFGIAGNDPLESVWRSNGILNALREGIPDRLGGVCGRCLMKTRCLGSCVAQNYYHLNNLWTPFWFCDAAEKEGLFPESRLRGQTAMDIKS